MRMAMVILCQPDLRMQMFFRRSAPEPTGRGQAKICLINQLILC